MPSGFGKNTFRSVKQKCADGFRALDPKLKILAGVAIVWGLLIWATSGTVVTVPQLATAVTSVLPIERAQFLAFWERSWWLFVKGWHATEFGLLYAVMHTAIRRFKVRFNPAFGLAITLIGAIALNPFGKFPTPSQ